MAILLGAATCDFVHKRRNSILKHSREGVFSVLSLIRIVFSGGLCYDFLQGRRGGSKDERTVCMRIKDRFREDRPREKIAKKGVESLSSIELAMAVIGSGNAQADVTKIARKLDKILKENDGKVSYADLMEITGMGEARVAQILAAIELGNHYAAGKTEQILDTPEKVLALLEDIRNKKQEYFVAITLDGANRLIKKRVITIGTLTASLVHPREVFADAISDRADSPYYGYYIH